MSHSTRESTKTNAAPAVALTSLTVGERVAVYVRASGHDPGEEWRGTILAVDHLGIRLAAESCKLDAFTYPESGIVFWPWPSIDSVEIAAPPA